MPGRDLLTVLRGNPEHTDSSYLRIYVAQLRRKLEAAARRYGSVLVIAGDWPGAQSRLLVAKGAAARLWRGSEPFGQGTKPDPSPIAIRSQ